MREEKPLRRLFWVSSTKDDLKRLPEPVVDDFGFALYLAQRGDKAESAKPLTGFGGAGVLEVVENHDGDAYRAVYTVRFSSGVYVLHVFQKKSKSGIATPQKDLDLIRLRLQTANAMHEQVEADAKKKESSNRD